MNVTITLPEPNHWYDGVPYWTQGAKRVSAWPQGVEVGGYLDEDVNGLEATALALLAAVHAYRSMGVTNGPATASGHPVIGAERAAQLAGGTQ